MKTLVSTLLVWFVLPGCDPMMLAMPERARAPARLPLPQASVDV